MCIKIWEAIIKMDEVISIKELIELPEWPEYLEEQNTLGVMWVIEELIALTKNEETVNGRANRLLGKKLDENYLLNNPIVTIQKSEDYTKLLDILDSQIDIEINKILGKYNPFGILISMLVLSDFLSKISFGIFENKNGDFINTNVYGVSNEISNLINTIREGNDEGVWDVRSILGIMKRSVEIVINYVLMDNNLEFSSSNIFRKIDYEEFLMPFCAKIYIFQIRNAKKLITDFSKIGISKRGIELPKLLIKEVNAHVDDSKDVYIDIYNFYTDEIYKIFKNDNGYDPYDLRKYVYANDNERAINMGVPIVFAVKELLVLDMVRFSKDTLSEDSSKKMIDCLMLNRRNFEKEKNIIEFSNIRENRIFYTPIIELGGYYIFSPWNMKEASRYFPLRILKRDLPIKFSNKLKESIKSNFDEVKLQSIDKMLKKSGRRTKVNYDLGQSEYFKRKVACVKGIPHELDLLFINDRDLVIVDSKNYHIEFSIKEMKSTSNKLEKERNKLQRLKRYFLSDKDRVQEEIGEKFDDIRLVILTVNPTLYERMNSNDDVEVYNISNFIKEFNCNQE